MCNRPLFQMLCLLASLLLCKGVQAQATNAALAKALAQLNAATDGSSIVVITTKATTYDGTNTSLFDTTTTRHYDIDFYVGEYLLMQQTDKLFFGTRQGLQLFVDDYEKRYRLLLDTTVYLHLVNPLIPQIPVDSFERLVRDNSVVYVYKRMQDNEGISYEITLDRQGRVKQLNYTKKIDNQIISSLTYDVKSIEQKSASQLKGRYNAFVTHETAELIQYLKSNNYESFSF